MPDIRTELLERSPIIDHDEKMILVYNHLWAIVQYGENIIWSVVAVDRPLFKEVTAGVP